MSWLNYHHLLYFWTVVREGSVSAASRKLRLSQSTVSEQLKALEGTLDVELFSRSGGKLTLTEVGTHVYRYADEIFTLGRELQDSLQGLPARRTPQLVVGIADVVPKPIAAKLLEPALALGESYRIVCYEGPQDRLLGELAVHALDVVITDAPVSAKGSVRAYSHLLGESGVLLFARADRAKRLRRGFPQSLQGEALLLPTANTSLRHALTRWLDEHGLHPDIRAEFQDSALLKTFGQMGLGAFPAAAVIRDDLCAQGGVEVVGPVEGIRERFYAVTVERKLRHPAVVAISEAAQTELFTPR